jgi:hypothetical protein
LYFNKLHSDELHPSALGPNILREIIEISKQKKKYGTIHHTSGETSNYLNGKKDPSPKTGSKFKYGFFDYKTNSSIRDQLMEKYNIRQKSLASDRELEECTFHPYINKLPTSNRKNFNKYVINTEHISSTGNKNDYLYSKKARNHTSHSFHECLQTNLTTTIDKNCLGTPYNATHGNFKTNDSSMNNISGVAHRDAANTVNDKSKLDHSHSGSQENGYTNNMIKRLKRFCKKFQEEITTKHPNFVKNGPVLLENLDRVAMTAANFYEKQTVKNDKTTLVEA